MDTERMWERFGAEGKYDAWCFGGDADRGRELPLVNSKSRGV